MILGGLLSKRPGGVAARALLAGAVAQSRQPALYQRMGAPDTVEGRFEMLSLHVIVLLDRLAREATAKDVRQDVFDAYVSDLDGALREMAVGDLAVGRRMRTLARAFYGRAKACGEAFSSLPALGPLEALLGRTCLEGRGDAGALAAYVSACRENLAGQAAPALLAGCARWPAP